MSLNTGMKMVKTETVTVENAAKTLGSGSLLVYGTPAMLLLVEKTAVALLDGQLDEGMTTVGTNLNVDHVSASPIGSDSYRNRQKETYFYSRSERSSRYNW